MKKMEIILMPDDDEGNAYTMECYTPQGVWLIMLQRTRKMSFAQNLDRVASQWKHGDPDIYAELMAACVLADKQVA